MNFNWADYLDAAHDFSRDASGSAYKEAYLRAAISRAYYAVYCETRDLLIDIDGYEVPKGGSVHKDLIGVLASSDDKARQKVAYLLKNLLHMRTRADYDNVFHNINGKVQGLLAEAEEIMKLLDRF